MDVNLVLRLESAISIKDTEQVGNDTWCMATGSAPERKTVPLRLQSRRNNPVRNFVIYTVYRGRPIVILINILQTITFVYMLTCTEVIFVGLLIVLISMNFFKHVLERRVLFILNYAPRN